MRHVAHTVEMDMRNAFDSLIFYGPEGQRPPVRPRHRWEDTIEMDF